MELEFDLSDLKESAVRRMLLKAIKTESVRSKPMHKRDEQGDDAEEADDENGKLVDLHREKGEPAPIPVTDEDLSEPAGEELVKASKKPSPKGKKVADGKYKAKQPPKPKG